MLYVTPPSQIGDRTLANPTAALPAREAEALKEYEQLFLFQMLKEMRKTVPDGGLLDSDSQKAHFEEMLDDFLAGEMAESGQFGVARQMAEQMHPQQGPPPAALDGKGLALPAGVALEETRTAIPIANDREAGVAIPRAPEGLPVEIGVGPGISLQRAHQRYRMEE